MLTAFDPVTWRPRRIAIAGVSGSRKSTLAKCLSGQLGISYVEIDSLFHGSNWEPWGAFVSDVETIISGDSWVIEWQYSAVRDQIVARGARYAGGYGRWNCGTGIMKGHFMSSSPTPITSCAGEFEPVTSAVSGYLPSTCFTGVCAW